MNTHINDSKVSKLIQHAKSVRDIPSQSRMVPHKNIRALLEIQAEKYSDKTFLIYYDQDGVRTEFSYQEFKTLVSQTANFLLSLGLAPGDRISTIAHNHSDTVIQYFAAFAIGVCVVPINAQEDNQRVQYILENSNAKVALVRAQYATRIERLQENLSSLEQIVVVGEEETTGREFHKKIRRQPGTLRSVPDVTLDDEALIVYTSGTTGNPKGVVLQQYNLLVDAKAIAEWHGMDDSQRMMCVLPIHHVNGTVVTLCTPLYFGGSTVLNRRFQTDRFFSRIAEEDVQVVSVVPTLLQYLVQAGVDISDLNLERFRHIICGAGPLTVELSRQFEETFNIPIIHGYGLSETTCYSCFLPVDLSPEEHRHWMQEYGYPSIGVPVPVNEMAIHDQHGNTLDPGDRGEIVIRGHNVMKYYFQNPEANAETFAHGWFRSGDEGFFKTDDRGRQFFFITGRIKELIIRGGVNIAPLEIDEILMHIEGVKAGIAVGFENDWYGEEVGAYVQLEEGASLDENAILNECEKHLSFHKQPKVVVFGDDIPVTSTGKYQRFKVAHQFRAWKTVQFREHS